MHIFQNIEGNRQGIFFEVPTELKNEILLSKQSNALLSKLNTLFAELNGAWPTKSLTESESTRLDVAAKAIFDAVRNDTDAAKAIDDYRDTAIAIGREMQERS